MSLEEIEAIKQLKARYFRFLDTKQWEAWGNVFTADAELVNPLTREEPLHGREEIVRTVSTNLVDTITVHHGHMPEIEILGRDRARGVWAMFDLLIGSFSGGSGGPSERLEGYGHYIEEYVKEDDGQWRIARLQLMRLHVATTLHARNPDAAAFP